MWRGKKLRMKVRRIRIVREFPFNGSERLQSRLEKSATFWRSDLIFFFVPRVSYLQHIRLPDVERRFHFRAISEDLFVWFPDRLQCPTKFFSLTINLKFCTVVERRRAERKFVGCRTAVEPLRGVRRKKKENLKLVFISRIARFLKKVRPRLLDLSRCLEARSRLRLHFSPRWNSITLLF